MILLELFWCFLQIGLFSFGGGYAAMPLIEHQVVDVHPWLSAVQFADVITISEMTPGPIAINAATFVGTRVAGIPGALAATCGYIVPSFVIVTLLAWVYTRYRSLSSVQGVLAGLRPAAVAMIASAAVTVLTLAFYGQRTLPAETLLPRPVPALLFAAALLLLRWKKPHPVLVILGTGAAGVLLFSLF